MNYAFDDRYTLTASFRADGSSRFGVDSRWGYFPSVSAGWTLSNEPFLKDALERVASIRLRASWGKSGNNDIGNYASIASISTGSYAFGNPPPSRRPTKVRSPMLRSVGRPPRRPTSVSTSDFSAAA